MELEVPPNFSKMKVEISFPNGSTEVKTFNEVREYAFSSKHLSICVDLLKYGVSQKGSLIYTLIE
jgi:hypothetical protein